MDSRDSFDKGESPLDVPMDVLRKDNPAKGFVSIGDPVAIEKAAMDAARKARPRVRVYRRRDGKPAKVLVSGCQGSGKTPQERAAYLFDQVVSECPDGPPDLILFLGDNLYPGGARSPNDIAFIKCFDEMYGKKFPNLAPIPCQLIIGNHDGDYSWNTHYTPNAKWGKEIELREVAHSYMPDDRYTTVEEKIKFANRTDYYFDELPKYSMWHLFDSIIIDGTQHFLVNSNSYPQDFYEYKKGKNILPSVETNQAQWIEEEYKKARGCDLLVLDKVPQAGEIRKLPLYNNAGYVRVAEGLYYVDKYANTVEEVKINSINLSLFDEKLETQKLNSYDGHSRLLKSEEIKLIHNLTSHYHGRKIIFDQHHPLCTSGKRGFYVDFDTALYPISENLGELQKILNKMTVSYNDLFIDIYMEQEIDPDLFNVAHDHFISIFNNKEDAKALYRFVQLTLGGGGQTTQARKIFTGHPYVGQHMKSSGCCIIREDPNDKANLLFEINAASNYPDIKPYKMLYSLKDHHPIIDAIPDKNVVDMRQRVLKICDAYLTNLSNTEPKPDANTPNVPPTKPPKDKPLGSMMGMGMFSNLGNKLSNVYTMAKQFFSHDEIKAQEIIAVHNMLAFFNQTQVPDFANCCFFLKTLLEALPNKNNEKDTMHLLYKTLVGEVYNPDLISNRYQLNLEEVLNPHFAFTIN